MCAARRSAMHNRKKTRRGEKRVREREGARGKKSVTRRVRRGGTAGAYREGLGRRSAASAAAQRQRQRVEGTAAADGGEGQQRRYVRREKA